MVQCNAMQFSVNGILAAIVDRGTMELDPEITAALKVVGDRLIQSNLDSMDGIVTMRKEVNRIGELFNATLDRGGVTTESRVIPGSPD